MAELTVKPARGLEAADIHHQRIVARFARTGYVAKGVTYMLMGMLALRAAAGFGTAANTTRAIGILDGPLLGKVALLTIGAGLAAYALWKLYEAIANPEDDEWNLRVGAAFIALVNGGIAVQAAVIVATTERGESSVDRVVEWSTTAIRLPLGSWALGAAGLSVAGYGLWQIYRGLRSKLDSQLRLGRMEGEHRRPAVIAARFGIAARGFVFVLIGFFVVQAAWHADPTQAKDFGRSMERLQQQPFGSWMLAAVAIGLFAYALYEFLRARYRHIPTV